MSLVIHSFSPRKLFGVHIWKALATVIIAMLLTTISVTSTLSEDSGSAEGGEPIKIIEVWPSAHVNGSSSGFSTKDLTEEFYTRWDPEDNEYYEDHFFTEDDVEAIEGIEGVERVVRGLIYTASWRPDTDKWRRDEIRWAGKIWDLNKDSEDPDDKRYIEKLESRGAELNMTGEEYLLSRLRIIRDFKILGVETSGIEGWESWYNQMVEGRFLKPGEEDVIIVSTTVLEEAGLELGDTLIVPLGGIREFIGDLSHRVDSRRNCTFQIIGVISSSSQAHAVIDLNHLMDTLKAGAVNRSSLLPLYNRLYVRAESPDQVLNVSQTIREIYPEAQLFSTAT